MPCAGGTWPNESWRTASRCERHQIGPYAPHGLAQGLSGCDVVTQEETDGDGATVAKRHSTVTFRGDFHRGPFRYGGETGGEKRNGPRPGNRKPTGREPDI